MKVLIPCTLAEAVCAGFTAGIDRSRETYYTRHGFYSVQVTKNLTCGEVPQFGQNGFVVDPCSIVPGDWGRFYVTCKGNAWGYSPRLKGILIDSRRDAVRWDTSDLWPGMIALAKREYKYIDTQGGWMDPWESEQTVNPLKLAQHLRAVGDTEGAKAMTLSIGQ